MAGRRSASTVPVALFASGSGSNVAALLEHRYTGTARPDYRCLIGNNSGAGVMALARARGLATYHVSGRTHPHPERFCARLQEILDRHGIELIVLAGYLKRLPAELVCRWPGRILNIHPALLPRHGGAGMYGLAPHRAVLAAGERETGVTVHLVTEEYDAGPILMRRKVAVRAGDSAESLARRVLAVEHDTYWRAVERAASRLAAGGEPATAAAAAGSPGAESAAGGRTEARAAALAGTAPGAPRGARTMHPGAA